MKIDRKLLSVTAMLALSANVLAESVHQTVPVDKLRTGDGANAVEKGQMETRKVDGAQGGQVARLKGSTPQWGFVAAWFGVAAPAGKSIARVRVYADNDKFAKYMLYIRTPDGQVQVGELKLPVDAAEGTFVDVDVPIDAKEEWNGLTIKKADASDLPSPWMDKISVVLPES